MLSIHPLAILRSSSMSVMAICRQHTCGEANIVRCGFTVCLQSGFPKGAYTR